MNKNASLLDFIKYKSLGKQVKWSCIVSHEMMKNWLTGRYFLIYFEDSGKKVELMQKDVQMATCYHIFEKEKYFKYVIANLTFSNCSQKWLIWFI